jgi:hypothetical protein
MDLHPGLTSGLGTNAAGVADFLAVIGRVNFERAAHFVQARANALADSLGKGVLDIGTPHAGDAR